MKRPLILCALFIISATFLFANCTGKRETPFPETNIPTRTIDAERTLTTTFTPTLEPTPTPQSPLTLTPSPLPSPSPTASTLPENPHAVVGVERDDVLNIREGPGVENPSIAIIPPYGTNIEVTGEGIEVANSIWIPVNYQGKQGWVNSHYLAKQVGQADPQLLEKSNQVLLALKRKDVSTLASFVHPEKCLCFSPYPTIQPQDLVFCPSQIKNLPSDNTQYMWGRFDGSGKPIQMTYSQYYDRFIYDVDFVHPEMIGFNQIIGTGNAINNIHEFYPQAFFVEYHFSGMDPQYGGMDWRSLRLVFEKQNQEWYLVCIIHGEWTI